MGTEKFVLHPGVGQNRLTDGASVRKIDGTSIAYIEQLYPSGLDRTSFFHGVVVPPDLQLVPPVNVVFRLVFRQIGAGAGDIYIRFGYNNIVPPTDRDAALVNLAPVAVTMLGVGSEVAVTFNVLSNVFASGEELILGVTRLGSDIVNDTFGSDVGLVRIDIEYTVISCEWTDGGGWLYPTDGAAYQVSIGSVAAPAVGVQLLVDTGHLQIGDGAWNGQHMVMGAYHLWIDAVGALRIKNAAPAMDLDGVIVGTQN